jgi:hypothetical protein
MFLQGKIAAVSENQMKCTNKVDEGSADFINGKAGDTQ